MVLYLDTCCLNRPFDDQRQPRVHLETEAVLAILFTVESGMHQLVSSDVLMYEIGHISDLTRRDRVTHLLGYAEFHQPLTSDVQARAAEFCAIGFKQLDALHLASAEACDADVFLTTDDR